MPLIFDRQQYHQLAGQRLRRFAAEVVRALAPVATQRPLLPRHHRTEPFALDQLQRAEAHGLKRRDEMMAWVLCAMVLGPEFAQQHPQVRDIIDDRHYDRAVLLTLLAMQRLEAEEPAT